MKQDLFNLGMSLNPGMTENEKLFWRVYASLQELFRVSDEDIEKNSDLKDLLLVVTKVVCLYRRHGADKIYSDHRLRKLEAMGIKVLKPKAKK
jgi:hypothetical protein